MPATIRRATAADAAALAALIREYWAFEKIGGFDAARTCRVLEGFFAQAHLGAAWIVEDGGLAAGYLVACYVYSIEHGGLTAEIDELYLRPSHRGAGTGRRLLAVAEDEFARAGCTSVALQLGRDNDDGRQFYTRCGYSARDGYELFDKALAAKPL